MDMQSLNHPHLFGEAPREPRHFKAMTKNFTDQTLWHEWVFASLIYVFLECGFCVAGKSDNVTESASYNAQIMEYYANIPIEELYEKKSNNYVCKLYLMDKETCPAVIIQGSGSIASLSQYFVMNVILTRPIADWSFCVKSTDFTVVIKGVCKLKRTRELARLFRDSFVCPVKTAVLPRVLKYTCPPLLQCLPDLVMGKIVSYLDCPTLASLKAALSNDNIRPNRISWTYGRYL